MDEELELGAGLLGVELPLVAPADEPEVPPALEDGVLLLEELELGELGELLLGEALGELLELLELLGELLAPPEAGPDLDASLEADPLVPVEAEPDTEPLAPEGDDGDVLLGEEAELELDEPGLDALFEPRSPPSPHAARPKARATALAMTESFMCPPWLGSNYACKLRARPNPLMEKGQSRAYGNLCRLCGSSYLPLPVVPLGLDGFFCALLELDEPAEPLEPEVPPAPDGLELPEAELPPPELPPPC